MTETAPALQSDFSLPLAKLSLCEALRKTDSSEVLELDLLQQATAAFHYSYLASSEGEYFIKSLERRADPKAKKLLKDLGKKETDGLYIDLRDIKTLHSRPRGWKTEFFIPRLKLPATVDSDKLRRTGDFIDKLADKLPTTAGFVYCLVGKESGGQPARFRLLVQRSISPRGTETLYSIFSGTEVEPYENPLSISSTDIQEILELFKSNLDELEKDNISFPPCKAPPNRLESTYLSITVQEEAQWRA